MSERQPQIGVRVEPEFRAEIKAEAIRRFGGNESLLLRESARVYLRLRRHLGTRYESVLGALIGDDEEVAA